MPTTSTNIKSFFSSKSHYHNVRPGLVEKISHYQLIKVITASCPPSKQNERTPGVRSNWGRPARKIKTTCFGRCFVRQHLVQRTKTRNCKATNDKLNVAYAGRTPFFCSCECVPELMHAYIATCLVEDLRRTPGVRRFFAHPNAC